MGTRALIAALLVVACRAPPGSQVTAADSLSLFYRTQQVAQVCLKVLALRDTLDLERHHQRVQAVKRLPQKLQDSVRVRDSLRERRWTSPP